MRVDDFPEIPETDDVVIQLENFKLGLKSRATGGDFDDVDYIRGRKLILGIPSIQKNLPKFIKICRTVDEFWEYIKGEFPSYAERRTFISEQLNPVIEEVEYETAEGSLEFSKNYEEKNIIGSGGFGQVYRYDHKLLNISFAVKIFGPAFYEGGGGEIERFFQEARMLFQLNHPSIVRVYDAGLIGNRPFIRMEYFDGLNLNQVLEKHGSLLPEPTFELMKNVISGLCYAHEKVGIIHRDLKPSNIMVAKPNQFRIIDFGLGIYVENELHSRFTKTGVAVASGYYNAPELIQNPKLIDKRSDIYSIGAIWYTMLLGHPPAGTTIDQKLSSISCLSKTHKSCILKCLADLDNRYNNCEELLNDMISQ